MNKQDLIKELTTATQRWITAVSNITDDVFNRRPSERDWSAREIMEHISIIDISTYRMIKSDQSIPTERDSKAKFSHIEEEFLNFDKKFSAWGPIIPPTEHKSIHEMVEKFKGVREKLIHHTQIQDLNLTCTEFSHPLFGTMTRYEWVHFVNVHAQRHFRQLENTLNYSDNLKG